MFFSRSGTPTETDLKYEDRLSHINMIDLLDNFRVSKKLPLHTLLVKQQEDVVNKAEEAKTSNPKDAEAKAIEAKPAESKADRAETADESKPTIPEKFYAINYFIYEADYKEKDDASAKKRFAVFYMSRDQDEVRSEKFNFLPLANAVIKTFYDKFPEETASLILPIHQCGVYLGLDKIPLAEYVSYFGMSRDHSVLAEVNPKTKKIMIHDSQSSMFSYFYLPSVYAAGFQTDYTSYNKQANRNLCGYCVFVYALSFLKAGDSSKLGEIEIDQKLIGTKANFLSNWQSISTQILDKEKTAAEVDKSPASDVEVGFLEGDDWIDVDLTGSPTSESSSPSLKV